MTRDDLKEELIATDDEFRRLHEEHQECERRLEALNGRTLLLSQDDEMEEKRIKLHKLALKDRMEQIVREHAAVGQEVHAGAAQTVTA